MTGEVEQESGERRYMSCEAEGKRIAAVSGPDISAAAVSASVLEEILCKKGYSCVRYDASLPIVCEGVRLYYEKIPYEPRRGYVVSEPEALLLPWPDVLWIYVGGVLPEEIRGRMPSEAGCICVELPAEPAELLGTLQDFFAGLHHLDNQLRKILYTGGTVEELTETVYDYLGTPLTVYDENYVILARVGNRPGLYPVEYNRAVGRYIYQEAAVHEWKEDSSMIEAMKTVGAHWWQMDQNTRSIYVNIRTGDGGWKGRMIMHPGREKLGEFHRCLAEYISRCLSLILDACPVVSGKIDQVLKEALSQSLKEGQSSCLKGMLPDIVGLLGWRMEDSYLCLCLRQTEQENYQDMHMEQLTCRNIEGKLPYSRAFCFDGYVVALVNLTRADREPEDIRMKMAYIIRDGMFRMGISMAFRNISRLPLFYQQAVAALEMEGRGDSWYHSFADFRLQYCMELLKRDRIGAEMSRSAMEVLRDYDRQNGTEMADTLGIYLRCERSIKQTAAALGINRTTVSYRLARIKELTGYELDDPDERLLLRILYEVERCSPREDQ